MELATALNGQTVQNVVRNIGINPNYWYPVGWSRDLRPEQVIPVTVWRQAIAIYRDAAGTVHALENACPHRGVELHRGRVQGDRLACPYHGWEFDGTTGNCVNIPYFPDTQKLPCAQAKSYPIQEKYGLIWIFPGDPALAATQPLIEVAEFDDPNWVMVPITAHFQAHFTVCNENAMDVFHGELHKDLQGWFDPVLLSLKSGEADLRAEYQVSYKGQLAKFLGLSDRADEVTTLPVTIHYCYPHYRSALQGVSSVYLMRLPVDFAESRSFAFFFFRVSLPQWLVRAIKPTLSWVIQRFMLQRFLNQDIEMMESEQKTYLASPSRRYVEINPAILALQKLMVRQYEQFMQQSSQSSDSPLFQVNQASEPEYANSENGTRFN
jgi:phenylpropionate dioxygenase-like ring-hydroxylating dioxygenase large terminal subunit